MALADAFARAGALVFGGGHVVLPLLAAEVVEPGRVRPDAFLAGYRAAQAVPGPLFTFAGYLGAVSVVGPGGIAGTAIALIAVFLPGFLLLLAVLPHWERLRGAPRVRAAMRGTNAAVVGMLALALYDPVFLDGIPGPAEFGLGLGLGCFVLLEGLRWPPWAVVLVDAVGGLVIAGIVGAL